jgi:hypothetical protein
MKKKFILIAALIAALAVVFTGCWDDLHGGTGSGGGGGGGASTIVWQPTITASTTINGGEYIGNTGIQAADKANTTFTAIAGGFTIAVSGSGYKPINIQTPNAGGTSYYTSEGFTACTTGTAYTITFMASVDTGTGQIRFKPNGGSFDGGQSIDTTPKAVTCSWTQASGNLQFDTGSTPVTSVITITGIKVTTP